MIEVRSGQVIRYNYLWARQADAGEEAGRKGRPVAVQALTGAGGVALLFPITSHAPGTGDVALEIPETEARRVGLRNPAWVIVNQWNEDRLDLSDAIEDPRPLGVFSRTFTQRIREAAIEAIKSRAYRSIARS